MPLLMTFTGTGTQTEPDGHAELRKVVEKKLGKQAAGREREREGEGEMENELCSECAPPIGILKH